MTAMVYCVGLGPGDPELITVKAERLISKARVIAYPAPVGGSSFARSIVGHLIPEDAIEIQIEIPMLDAEFAKLEAYDVAASAITSHLDRQESVVVLCQRDPFFYGSFIYLFERLKTGNRIEIIPGVTSMTACAGAALQPLCGRMDVLTILPATLPATELESRLSSSDPFVIMKVGRHLSAVKEVLGRAGRLADAVFVSHASLRRQRIVPLSDAADPAPYFSTVIVPGRNLLAVC